MYKRQQQFSPLWDHFKGPKRVGLVLGKIEMDKFCIFTLANFQVPTSKQTKIIQGFLLLVHCSRGLSTVYGSVAAAANMLPNMHEPMLGDIS